jgi:hypothetical protein
MVQSIRIQGKMLTFVEGERENAVALGNRDTSSTMTNRIAGEVGSELDEHE